MTDVPAVGAVVDYVDEKNHKRARLIVVHVNYDRYGEEPLLYLAERPIAPLGGDEGKLYHPLSLIYDMNAGWRVGAVDPSSVVDTGERVKVVPFEKTDEYRKWRGCTFDGREWRDPPKQERK